MEEEISLLEIFQFLIKHSFTIIFSTLVGAVIAALVAIFLINPTYSSRAELIVNQRSTEATTIAQSDINTSIMLINTYRNIILADSTVQMVNDELGNRFSNNEIKEALNVTQQQNSQTFVVSAEMESPQDAQEVVQTTIDVFSRQVQDFYQTSNPNIMILSPASFNPNRVSPNVLLYTMIGAMLGFIISLGILFINTALDTRIKNPSFVEELGLVNLGGITDIADANSKEYILGPSSRADNKRRKV
ncbi:YveK family protein [Fundicoccus sp. Sow4_H7]|uniref:YveK family protein n=1 Tax=Fundicoccus sp. Sow4_H7 TaxID=3438784 RepID=UPI003F911BBE